MGLERGLDSRALQERLASAVSDLHLTTQQIAFCCRQIVTMREEFPSDWERLAGVLAWDQANANRKRQWVQVPAYCREILDVRREIDEAMAELS